MAEITTAQQWDDEWWRLWEDAQQDGRDGIAASAHADLQMSERHGLRPDDPPALRGFRLDELLAEVDKVDAPSPSERSYVYPFSDPGRRRPRGVQADLVIVDELQRFMATDKIACEPTRRGWLGRLLDRMFG